MEPGGTDGEGGGEGPHDQSAVTQGAGGIRKATLFKLAEVLGVDPDKLARRDTVEQ